MGDLQEPLIRTPFTDLGAAIFTTQKGNNPCQDFEMRWMNCMEAYGKSLGKQKCQSLKDDLFECQWKPKQRARMYYMMKERERQYKQGERSKEDYYAPIPKPDSY